MDGVKESFDALPENTYLAGSWSLDFSHTIIDDALQFYHRQKGLANVNNLNGVVLDTWTGLKIPIRGGFSTSAELKANTVEMHWQALIHGTLPIVSNSATSGNRKEALSGHKKKFSMPFFLPIIEVGWFNIKRFIFHIADRKQVRKSLTGFIVGIYNEAFSIESERTHHS